MHRRTPSRIRSRSPAPATTPTGRRPSAARSTSTGTASASRHAGCRRLSRQRTSSRASPWLARRTTSSPNRFRGCRGPGSAAACAAWSASRAVRPPPSLPDAEERELGRAAAFVDESRHADAEQTDRLGEGQLTRARWIAARALPGSSGEAPLADDRPGEDLLTSEPSRHALRMGQERWSEGR
jgi:hypothetical protein